MEPRLIEIGSGELTGRSIDELDPPDAKFVAAWFEGSLGTPPAGECVADFNARVARAVGDLVQLPADWLVLAHLGVVHAAASLVGLEASAVGHLSGLLYQEGRWSRWNPPDLPATATRVGVGADHHGRPLLSITTAWLTENGFDVVPFTDPYGEHEIDYPDVAIEVATQIRLGNIDRAVLICGTGIGMAIAANAVEGVRAASVADPYSAHRASASNDAQVLTFGAQVLGERVAPLLLEAWLAETLNNTRSLRKITRIIQYESGVRMVGGDQ